MNLPLEWNIKCVHTVKYGLKDHKDAHIWNVDAVMNSVINVVEFMEDVSVILDYDVLINNMFT